MTPETLPSPDVWRDAKKIGLSLLDVMESQPDTQGIEFEAPCWNVR